MAQKPDIKSIDGIFYQNGWTKDPSNLQRSINARVTAQKKLREWGVVGDWDNYDVLRELIGYQGFLTMPEEQIRLAELLGGPNGYAIYKVLLARVTR